MNDQLLVQLYLRFTERKREIIELVCHGLGNAAIGERLYISPATVADHLTEIYDELRTVEALVHVQPNRLVLISLFAPFFDRNPLMRCESLRREAAATARPRFDQAERR